MRMKSILPAAAIAALALQGCASLDHEAEPNWRMDPNIRPLADTDATTTGSRFVVANPRNIVVVDGDTGEARGAVGEESRFNVTVRVGGTVHHVNPRTSTMVTLPDSDMVLMFDYEGSAEQITAMNMTTGETAWNTTDYRYSIQQYEATIRHVASQAGQTIASVLGGQASGESLYNQRRRQRLTTRGLVAPVADGDAFLFKTYRSLIKLDAASGRELWRVPEFNGPGIKAVETLSNGDYLVLSSGQDLSLMQAATEYSLARISPRGTVRWVSEHSGTDTTGMQLDDTRVVVDGTPLQVFNLANGRLLWEGPDRWVHEDSTDARFMPMPDPLITANGLYRAAPTHGEDGEWITVGAPHRIRSFDPVTGEVQWETDEYGSYFGELHKVGDKLLVWGVAEFFGETNGGGIAALDRSTGEVVWRSPQLETPGLLGESRYVVDPVFDARREHVFLAGPEDMIGVRIADGETVMHINLGDRGVGEAVGLVRHGNQVVVVGEDGTASFDMHSGEQRFMTETPFVADFSQHDERLVLRLQGGFMVGTAEQEDDDYERGLVSLNMNTGALGDVVAWEPGLTSIFGVLYRGDGFVTDDGRNAFIIDEDRKLVNYPL